MQNLLTLCTVSVSPSRIFAVSLFRRLVTITMAHIKECRRPHKIANREVRHYVERRNRNAEERTRESLAVKPLAAEQTVLVFPVSLLGG
jgi:hypothetical protein